MRAASRVLLFVTLLVAVVVVGRPARAESGAHAAQVAVIALDSEDAEDQADALTSALRRSVQGSPGWALTNTTQSLAMLTAALKCPARPPPECQQRIAEQLKAERFVWGTVQKGPAGQVTAEVHLYQRGKSDTVVREQYADNLKDANDDTLRKIAQRMVDKLGGTALGVVVVRAGNLDGEVVVDGEKKIPLHGGTVRIELAAGSHSIELVAQGASPTKRNVLVTAGRDTILEMAGPAPKDDGSKEDKPFFTRRVTGAIVITAGLVLGAVAVQQALVHFGKKSDADDYVAQRKGTPAQVQDPEPCKPAPGQVSYDQSFCNIDKDARVASGLAIGFGAGAVVALGIGTYIFFSPSDDARRTGDRTPPKKKTTLTPTFGGTNGFVLSGSF